MTAVNESAKRGDIVEAAQELFGERGYDKTSVREIASRAHVAVGTIYSYFGQGKENLLGAALDARISKLFHQVLNTPAELDAVDAFLYRVRLLNTELVSDPFLRRMITDEQRFSEPRIRERGMYLVELVSGYGRQELETLVEQKKIVCDDVDALNTLLRAATHGWIVADRMGQPQTDHDRMIDTLLLAVRALLATPAKSRE